MIKYIRSKEICYKIRVGGFLRVINGTEPDNRFKCEVYITSAKPGESKGGHYHLMANEWFTLVKRESVANNHRYWVERESRDFA